MRAFSHHLDRVLLWSSLMHYAGILIRVLAGSSLLLRPRRTSLGNRWGFGFRTPWPELKTGHL